VRLIAVPRFKDTGQLVLLDVETLEVELLQIQIF
jgi:DNA polymerase delta subunit 2